MYLFIPVSWREKKKEREERRKKRKEPLGIWCQEAKNLKGYINQGKSILSALHSFHTGKKKSREWLKKQSSQNSWSPLKSICKNKKNRRGIIFTDKPSSSCHIHSKNKTVPRRVTLWSAVKVKFNLAITIDKVCQPTSWIKTMKKSLNEMLLTYAISIITILDLHLCKD